MTQRRPNIVIFNPDQWRGDVLGHMGNPAAVTPNVDRAAATDFVSFRNAFCQNPVCTPSRCSFMTGWYPHVRGHRTMHHMLHVEHGEPVLLKTLKDHGYFVWWGGKNDLTPGQEGLERFCDVKYQAPPRPFTPHPCDDEDWRGPAAGDKFYSFYRGRLYGEEGENRYRSSDWVNVLGAVEQIHSAPKDRPFCIYLPLNYPHPTYAVADPYYSMIDRAKVPPRVPAPVGWRGKPSMLKAIWERQKLQGLSEEFWRELRGTYYGMCAQVDDQFGRILAALKEAGIYDDTAVFLFSDHGDFTGDYGLVEKTQNTFEDCLTRVPLLIKPPRGVPVRPRVSEAMVELVDFPATVEALAGIAPQHTHFGRSLLPVIAGATDFHRDAVFCEGGRLRDELHCREHEHNPTQDPDDLYWPRQAPQHSTGPEHTKAVMCRTERHKYVRRLYESDELYDLRQDPREMENRIDDPALADVLAELKDRMLTFFLETGDVVPWQTDRR